MVHYFDISTINPGYVTLYQVFLVSGALQVGMLSPESHILIVAGPNLPTYGGLIHHDYSLLGGQLVDGFSHYDPLICNVSKESQ